MPRGDATVRFYGSFGGAPTVLVLVANGSTDTIAAFTSGLRRGAEQRPIAVIATDHDVALTHEGFHDAGGDVHAAYGIVVDGPPVVVVLDPTLRVLALGPIDDPGGAAERVAGVLAGATFDRAPRTVTAQAPVLFVPHALSRDLRARAIDLWGSQNTVETGVETTHGGGRGEVYDDLRKRRRDHTVEDERVLQELTTYIGRRVLPEVERAFAYRPTRFEGFKIGAYDESDAGFFEAHRDNLSPTTAHRRFGLTLNLNDEYEGGELRFPEYGPELYRPASGEALVFSGALLHEVLPVTAGRRFVLLSFLYGEGDRRA